MQNNSPKPTIAAIKAIILRIFGVQVDLMNAPRQGFVQAHGDGEAPDLAENNLRTFGYADLGLGLGFRVDFWAYRFGLRARV